MVHKDEANTLTQPIWMEGERSGWIMPARGGAPAGRRGLGRRRALPGSRERACRGDPPRLPWAQASSARSPPCRRERAPGELRPSRHGCTLRAAAPRPPQVQAKATSVRLPVRARELRPAATGAGAGELCPAARSCSLGQVPPWHVQVGCGRWRGKFWTSSDSLK